MGSSYRIGMIVPSSNTTMETEIPAMLRARSTIADDRFTFHSSRMRMRQVTQEALTRMDRDSDRCTLELTDARCDVIAYACLVAVMCQGAPYHEASELRLAALAKAEQGYPVPVVSSAGALLEAIRALGASRIALVAPYLTPLTTQVIEYLEASGIQVTDSISLEVSDNLEVGRLDPADLVDTCKQLDLSQAQALVVSACVQMPSLPVIQPIEDHFGLPVLSAATATTFRILQTLGLDPVVPDAGALLGSGRDRAGRAPAASPQR